jgi:predicted phosphodiesterase/DNA-binding Lrp family transcriptional regulator
MSNHTDAQLVEELKLVRAHKSIAAAARFLGCDRMGLNMRIKEAEQRGLTADTPIRNPLEKAKAELVAARADIKKLQKEHDTAEAIRRKIYGLAERTPEPPEWVDPEVRVKGNRGVPMMLWSDWHYGEVVRPEEVGGMNTFNAEVAAERITLLVDTSIDLAFNHMGRAEKDYPGAVVCLGGDMLSGDIHEELFATNDRTTQQCINDLTDLLAAALERVADKFGKVFVPCVVGNHGRASRKPRMKGRVYTSHEWNIYCSLERHFRRDSRIQFLIPGETDAYFKVYGHRFLLTHGDSLGVKGGDGIIGAIGPIMRGKLKVGHSEAEIGRNVDTILMGHWHQMLWLPGCIVNGALKGYDEYARLAMRAPYSQPSQALWFVHPEHGITAKWEVFLDKARNAEERTWLSWQE